MKHLNVYLFLQLGGNPPNNLQYINLIIETQAKCKQAHSRVQASHICTYTKVGEGACHVSIVIIFYIQTMLNLYNEINASVLS